MYKLIIADDEPYIRLSIRNRINWARYHMEVAGEARNGKAAYEMVLNLKPDILLLDIKMPVMDGIQCLKLLTENRISVKVIILSAYQDFEYVREALRCGAADYILKPVNEEEIGKRLKRIKEELDAIPIPETEDLDIISQIKRYVENAYMKDLNATMLSEQFHINSSYLSALFKEKSGMNLTGYIENVRMTNATELLKRKECSISLVASAVGYGDPGYFSKVFKKYSGMTPVEYRRLVLTGEEEISS